MSGLLLDLRRAYRSLSRAPGFTIAAGLTLALGLGANSAVLGVVRGTLLRPLPFREPERLVVLGVNFPRFGIPRGALSAPLYEDIRRQSRSFQGLFAFTRDSMNLSGDGRPERLGVVRVSAGAAEVLGVAMSLGRGFTPEEDVHGGPKAVVMAHHLWQQRFGSDPAILGSSVRLNGETHTVVGVLAPGVRFPVDDGPTADAWIPMAFAPKERSRGYHDFKAVARLGPTTSLARARSDLGRLVRLVWEQNPGVYDLEWSFSVDPIADEAVRDVRGALLLLQGAVVFVLLIACVNVANLLVARFSFRRRETVIRQALGASWPNILRMTLSESLLLALGGGLLGLLVADAITMGFARLSIESLGSLDRGHESGFYFATHAGLSLLSGLLVGLVPSFRAASRDLAPGLHEGAAQSGQGRRTHRLRAALMVAETALALVMLVGAGLLVRSLRVLVDVDPGFRPAGVTAVRLSAPASRYGDMAQVSRFFANVLDRVGSLPGVERAGAVSHLPLSGDVMTTSFVLEEAPAQSGQPPHAPFSYVMPGYFEAMGIRLLSGRTFTSRDTRDSTPVVVVNEAFASTHWPGRSALGRRLAFISDGPPVWREVVGVTGSVVRSAQSHEPEAAFHMPVAQRPFALDSAFEMTLVVRSALPTEALLAPMRGALETVDAEQPFYDVRPLSDLIARSLAVRRVVKNILGGFALVALVLAAVGIYGVTAYATGERRREIGVRVALGAHRRQILGLVLGQGLRLTAIGLAAGLLGSLALSQGLRGLLYRVQPADPVTYVMASLILGTAAGLACLLPALRASVTDPAEALRAE